MLHFILLIRRIAPAPDAAASPAQLAWAFIFALAMLLPWLLFDIVTGLAAGYALTPGVLLELGWPVTAGLLIGWGLSASGFMVSRPPTSGVRTRGEVLMALWDGLEQSARGSVQRLFALEAASRRWETSSSLLVLVMLVLTILLGIAA